MRTRYLRRCYAVRYIRGSLEDAEAEKCMYVRYVCICMVNKYEGRNICSVSSTTIDRISDAFKPDGVQRIRQPAFAGLRSTTIARLRKSRRGGSGTPTPPAPSSFGFLMPMYNIMSCTAVLYYPSAFSRSRQREPCSCREQHFPRVLEVLLDLDCWVRRSNQTSAGHGERLGRTHRGK